MIVHEKIYRHGQKPVSRTYNSGKRAKPAQKEAVTRPDSAQSASIEQGEQKSTESGSARKPKENAGKPQAETPENPKSLAPERTQLANPHARTIPAKNLGAKTISHRPWEKLFFQTLSQTANITISCKSAGISRRVVYDRKAAHPDFAERMHECCEQAVDLLEACAWNRATRGTERGIWSKDKEGNPVKVETIFEYSDRLHEILLRAHRPEKYSPKIQQEITTAGGLPIMPSAPLQVIFNIPDNGRGCPMPLEQANIIEQISPAEQIAELNLPPAPIEPAQPEEPLAEPLGEQERKARAEEERQQEIWDRLKAQGRASEGQGQYPFRGKLNTPLR